MTPVDPERIRRDLPSDLDPGETEQMIAVGMRLAEARPLPDPNFRGELSRRLAGARPGPSMPRRRARAFAAAYALPGLLLLAVAGAGVAGGGPFAA
jgi:hypothetical protein